MLLWNAIREEDQNPRRLEGKVYTNPRQRALLPGEQGPVVAVVGRDATEDFRLVGSLQNRSKPYALKMGMSYVSVIWS